MMTHNISVHVVDSRECTTSKGLFGVLSKTFEFPDYFGFNWNALDECLSDLEWLQSYSGWLLVFMNSEYLLINESVQILETLFDVLNTIGNEWSEPRDIGLQHAEIARSFHSVFHVDHKSYQACLDRFAKADNYKIFQHL